MPDANENGPDEFAINPQVEVTVTIYRNGKVKASHAIPAGGLTKQQIRTIIADTAKILN